MNCKEKLVRAGREMLGRGLTVETFGNLSIRDPETGLVYLTPSAMAYHTITEEDVVVMDLDGNLVEGRRKPTIEKEVHLSLYRAHPEVNAIIHTHPVHSQVFAVLRKPIPPVMDEAAQVLGGTVRVAEYALPGTEALAQSVCAAMEGRVRACLMANHGAVCVGATMEQAFKVCTVLEMTAEVYRLALSVGEPVVLPDELVDEMWDFANNRYGK
jgi:L-fuculose-phosphate aldolase